MGKGRTHVVLSLGILLACCACLFASSPSVDVTQYVRTAWTSADGFFPPGNIYAMAQRPDGNLGFGGESGPFRFDAVRSSPWQAPAGQHLPDKNLYGLTMKDGFPGHREGKADSTPRQFQSTQGQTAYAQARDLTFAHLIQGILEDKAGRLRLSTTKGISRFDPQTETFRNYFDGPRKLPVQTFLTRCPRSVADCEQRQLDKRTA
jgi:hypothetical protein